MGVQVEGATAILAVTNVQCLRTAWKAVAPDA